MTHPLNRALPELRVTRRRTRFGVALEFHAPNAKQPGHFIRLGVLSCNARQAQLLETLLTAGGRSFTPSIAVAVVEPADLRSPHRFAGKVTP